MDESRGITPDNPSEELLILTMTLEEAKSLQSWANIFSLLGAAMERALWDWGKEESPHVSARGDAGTIVCICAYLDDVRFMNQWTPPLASNGQSLSDRFLATKLILAKDQFRKEQGSYATVVRKSTGRQRQTDQQELDAPTPSPQSNPRISDGPDAKNGDLEEAGTASGKADAELDDVDKFEEEERPDDAVPCAYCDQAFVRGTCSECGGRRWLSREEIEERLGHNRVPCYQCGGEGQVDSFGPCSFACLTCLGTGKMPVENLKDSDFGLYPIEDEDWSGTDLRGVSLRGVQFYASDFSHVNFEGANLENVCFYGCNFDGANPELAASVVGTRLLVEGLSEEQLARCVDRGAIVEEEDDEEAEE